MKRENPFKMSAMNSLQVHQIQIKDEKLLLNTFKGGNDLRNQLNNTNKNHQTFNNNNANKSKNTNNINANDKLNKSKTNTFQQIKPQHQILYDQIAALDQFKPAVTRQKTKKLLQSITLRRREQHIESQTKFKQDLDDYKQNLLSIYQSIHSDTVQVLNIKQVQLQNYYNSQKDEYLLTRERQILTEFNYQYQNYVNSTNQKIKYTYQQLQRIKLGRGTVVDQTCQRLRQQLIQIAFVLEHQARSIENIQKLNILQLEQKYYQKYFTQTKLLQSKLIQTQNKLKLKLQNIIKKWKQLKQTFQSTQFQNKLQTQQYQNPKQRQIIYSNILKLQIQNHQNKKNKFISLIHKQHVDSLRKINVDKWYEIIKSINEEFDKKLDQLVKQLMIQNNQSKQKHLKLLSTFTARLNYINNRSQQQVTQLISQKFNLLIQNNIKNSQQQMKNVTNYVQKNDQKQNLLYENIYKFISLISNKNDDFIKQFITFNQKYQIQKAKILDDDEENIQKLQTELQTYKKSLKQSLHHIKLQQIQKKCFQKIDQIQQSYRKTHEKNKILVNQRPQQLIQFMLNFQSKMAEIFQLYQSSKRNELINKNKQHAEKQALKRIQQQDKKKAQQQAKQLQQILAKGGKAPPAAKPKDPKKAAIQLQQRKKLMLLQIGDKKIQELKMSSGNIWLVYKTLQQICKQFYKVQQNKNQQEEKKQQQSKNQIRQQNILEVDQLPPVITDINGNLITTNQSILSLKSTSTQLLVLRDNIFKNIDIKKQRILQQSSTSNQQIIDQSLIMLDNRLKKHYSLKGELQSQIFIKRSGQITNHKKRYQKYARSIRQKMDNQTQRFNFLLQKSLQLIKKHNSDQKSIKQKLPISKNLSQLQGLLSKSRENHNQFTNQIKEISNQLLRLSSTQIQILLKKNQDFIKQSKTIQNGGEYSQQQIKWYKQMMQQINTQIITQKQKRQQKTKQIQTQSNKIKKDLLDKFQKQYNLLIQQLSAKDGTGKKYGKPKRIAQQKIRLQMNKCQKAQLNINQQIQSLYEIYNKQKSFSFNHGITERPQTLSWRKYLMTIYTCIQKYCRHIQALKPQLKIKPMPRVNYDQQIPDFVSINIQQDKKLLQQQLKQLGPLSQQKQQKSFIKFIIDIQKIISDQARTIYTGDKAKYLTGNDKIPDFLRKYILNMKKSAQDFRQTSIRQLRQSCNKLSEICQRLSQMFFTSIQLFYKQLQQNNYNLTNKSFNEFYQENQINRKQNLRCLRPNLSNPKCQIELTQLNTKQLQRQSKFIQQIKKIKEKFTNYHFKKGTEFINTLINNYQFLLTYFDSLFLYEDFVKVVGDDQDQKNKLNLKKLMIIKQKGLNVDSSSQRNIKKKWEGVNFTIINFQDKKYVYKKPQVQDPNLKDPKKAAKKQTKKPAGKTQQAPILQNNQSNSRSIQTFKSIRQKSVYQYRQKCLQSFKLSYISILQSMLQRLQRSLKENQMFNNKWNNIAKELFLK